MHFLGEILEHAKQQPPEDTLVAVGEMHTTESITICIEEILAGDFPGLQAGLIGLFKDSSSRILWLIIGNLYSHLATSIMNQLLSLINC